MLEKSSNFKNSDLGFLFRRFFFLLVSISLTIHSFFSFFSQQSETHRVTLVFLEVVATTKSRRCHHWPVVRFHDVFVSIFEIVCVCLCLFSSLFSLFSLSLSLSLSPLSLPLSHTHSFSLSRSLSHTLSLSLSLSLALSHTHTLFLSLYFSSQSLMQVSPTRNWFVAESLCRIPRIEMGGIWGKRKGKKRKIPQQVPHDARTPTTKETTTKNVYLTSVGSAALPESEASNYT